MVRLFSLPVNKFSFSLLLLFYLYLPFICWIKIIICGPLQALPPPQMRVLQYPKHDTATSRECIVCYASAPIGWGIKRCFCLTSVCLTSVAYINQSINQFNSNLAAREPDSKYAVEIIDKNSKRKQQCAYMYRCRERCIESVRSHYVGW